MTFEILSEHHPVEQILGPVSVLMMCLKHRDFLYTNLTDPVHKAMFVDDKSIVNNILSFLYNKDSIELNEQAINAIQRVSGNDADCLKQALIKSKSFSPEMKLHSIHYMNNIISADSIFFAALYARTNYEELLKSNNPAIMYLEGFDGLTSRIRFPEPEIAINKLGIYSSLNELYAYTHSTGDLYSGAYSVYANPYESSVAYAYKGLERTIPAKEALRNYIISSLSSEGSDLKGWKFKPGMSLEERDMNLLLDHVYKHFDTSADIKFSESVLHQLKSRHGRSLQDQIFASLSRLVQQQPALKNKLNKA